MLRGNWSPYIPRNIILRYSQEGDLVLDQFAGGGTTLVEAKLLNRDIIGVDVNDVALERCREKTAFNYEPARGKVYIKKGDARNLDFIPDNSVDLICTHPPYADIIKYRVGITLLCVIKKYRNKDKIKPLTFHTSIRRNTNNTSTQYKRSENHACTKI